MRTNPFQPKTYPILKLVKNQHKHSATPNRLSHLRSQLLIGYGTFGIVGIRSANRISSQLDSVSGFRFPGKQVSVFLLLFILLFLLYMLVLKLLQRLNKE